MLKKQKMWSQLQVSTTVVPASNSIINSHETSRQTLLKLGTYHWSMEAIGRGFPFLAWPVRGDQYFNAKFVVSHLKVGSRGLIIYGWAPQLLILTHLKVGYRVTDDSSKTVKKDDKVEGIKQLMGDEAMKKRAKMLSARFEQGFPTSSVLALDAFL